MRALGAIVIGIGAYRYDGGQLPQLRYASEDASQFAEYLGACWPGTEEATVIRIGEDDATLDGITKAFATLAREGPYQLVLVFLSGHGVVERDNAGFVVQPAPSAGISLLDAVNLDRLLDSVSARQTVLIVDCCYAEAITQRMKFFGILGASEARLFIASSRKDQRTWEDERIRHGVFTAHLLDLVRTGSSIALNGVRDRLEVEGELFRVLCDQVPLYVFEHKNATQEPVKGGVSSRSITLPVARAGRRVEERTAFATALRRVRQIAAGAAMAAAAVLLLAYVFTYYVEADRYGGIRLHHGMRWLAPAFRFVPNLRTDTGIAWTELSDDPANRYAVQAGETWGFWTQLSRHGYRAWSDAIRPSLSARAAARYDVLVAAGETRPVYRLSEESRPSEVAFAAWALLDESDSDQLKTLFQHVLGADRTSTVLAPFPANDLDFNILDLPQSELGSFADALRSTAAVDPTATFIPYVGFLKANRIWLAHSSLERHGQEAQRRASEDVADVLAVIAKARIDRGMQAMDAQMTSLLNGLAEMGYDALVRLAVSRASSGEGTRRNELDRALAAFHGNPAEPAEAEALRRMKSALDSSAGSRLVVEEAYKRFVAVVGSEQADLTGFLIAAADKKALPSTVISIMLDKAREAVSRREKEFIDTEYARILAHAMSQVPEASRSVAYQLIESVTAAVTPKATSTAEMYAALGRQGLETEQMFERMLSQARKAPPYRPQNPELVAEPLPGLSIVVGYGPWLEAFAIVAARRPVPGEAIEILERHVVDPSLRDTILRALVRQTHELNQSCWETSCSRLLKRFAKDSGKRQLAADILSEKLADLPRDVFVAAVNQLRRQRLSELEPEIRIALGAAIVNAQLARVRTTPIGSQLFELAQ